MYQNIGYFELLHYFCIQWSELVHTASESDCEHEFYL